MNRKKKQVIGQIPIKFGGKVDYDFMPDIVTKDNGKTYNKGSGSQGNVIRVPSLKRSNRVWKQFYELYPSLKGRKIYMGSPLKKLKL